MTVCFVWSIIDHLRAKKTPAGAGAIRGRGGLFGGFGGFEVMARAVFINKKDGIKGVVYGVGGGFVHGTVGIF
jgi:hypothetical protein